MRMWSGSHKDNLKQHDQKFNEGNLLTRGQTVKDVPKEEHDTFGINCRSNVITSSNCSSWFRFK